MDHKIKVVEAFSTRPRRDADPVEESPVKKARKPRKKPEPTPEELEELSRLESEGGVYNGDRDS